MMKVLVIGSKGQLGRTLKKHYTSFKEAEFIFTTKSTLDITNKTQVVNYFNKNQLDYCINCAAYTNVEKAEEEPEAAFLVNAEGVKYLAESCKNNNVILVYISTDYVFDGKKNVAYIEKDHPNPINIYGLTKYKGEEEIKKIFNQYFIIRTSWLYSEYGSNFMKTMIRLSSEKKEIKVVDDQIGSPTYTSDLASVILQLIVSKNNKFGIYHYSNEGETSWYDFAKAIIKENKQNIKLTPIKLITYSTLAQRPKFSILDKSKIKNTLNINIHHWRDSLKKAIKNYNEQQS